MKLEQRVGFFSRQMTALKNELNGFKSFKDVWSFQKEAFETNSARFLLKLCCPNDTNM